MKGYSNIYDRVSLSNLASTLDLRGKLGYEFVQAVNFGPEYLVFFKKEEEITFLQSCLHCDHFQKDNSYCSLHEVSTLEGDVCDYWCNLNMQEDINRLETEVIECSEDEE